jgi:hypothetical protein
MIEGGVLGESSALEGWERAHELRRELKVEWAELWKSKYDDKVKAEGISSLDFEWLFVDRGEVIYATKDYKPLSFREILERHIGADVAGRIAPDPEVGGWRKFVKENITIPKRKPVVKRERPRIKFDASQQKRKGGAGWLNKARVRKKIQQSEYGY